MARGGMWFIGQLAVMTAAAVLGPMGAGAGRTQLSNRLGGTLMIASAVIAIAGVWALGRHTSPLPRPRESAQLVRHGIYRRIRHPLYTSLMLAGLGWAVFWWSRPALVAAIVLTALLDRKSRREERWMGEKFPGYAEYRQTTKRYVPWVY